MASGYGGSSSSSVRAEVRGSREDLLRRPMPIAGRAQKMDIDSLVRAIKAFAQQGKQEEVLSLLAEHSETMRPDDAQYLHSAAIKIYADLNRWRPALAILLEMHQRGPKPNLVCYNAGITAMVRGQQPGKALEVMQLVKNEGLQPDNFTFSSVMKAYGMLKQWQEALALLDQMPQVGVSPNAHAYCAAINACEKGGQWMHAVELLDVMQQRGVKPNTITCTSVISACKVGGHWSDALKILHRMPEMGCPPDAHSYTNAISACDRAGKWSEAVTTFEEMRTNGVAPTLITYGAVLNACEAGRQWARSVALLEEMPMAPDRIACKAVIGACSKASRWSEAVVVLSRMVAKKLKPDQNTFDMVVGVCSKAGQHQQAIATCLQGRSAGIQVSTNVLDQVVVLAAKNDWEEALSVLSQMEANGMERSMRAFDAAGGACVAAGQQEQAMKMWRGSGNWSEAVAIIKSGAFALAQASSQSDLLNDAFYVCSKAGMWEQALTIYEEMTASEVTPEGDSLLAAAGACRRAQQHGWANVLDEHRSFLSMVDAGM